MFACHGSYRISTARQGAPSAPPILMGRQTNWYSPGFDGAQVEALDGDDAGAQQDLVRRHAVVEGATDR